ncbi:hypothetical protein DSO57_1010293 [Entomophthora muscae]|uniref:Uncharacterized protein n=1 Tax=Entomophthora muscae TaxID=34485 RepID=A0ACC2T6G7_9FUNG|nr:hypothetical protein DSO57_1010293 [Entomophthora muscae]
MENYAPRRNSSGSLLTSQLPPEETAEWYDTGATAAEATIFKQGGWNPATVTNWLQTNNLKYSDINKFIHATISPALAVEWKKLGFSATEALQWAAMEIQVDLARKLREMKVHPTKVSVFLNSGYTIDESIEFAIKKTPLKSAPPLINQTTFPTATELKKDWKLNSTRRALSPLKRPSENTQPKGTRTRQPPDQQSTTLFASMSITSPKSLLHNAKTPSMRRLTATSQTNK